MFKLPDSVQEKVQEIRERREEVNRVFPMLSDSDLAASAEFWMQHCDAPRKWQPGEPIYDATFWHAIAPEMIRRLKGREK